MAKVREKQALTSTCMWLRVYTRYHLSASRAYSPLTLYGIALSLQWYYLLTLIPHEAVHQDDTNLKTVYT